MGRPATSWLFTAAALVLLVAFVAPILVVVTTVSPAVAAHALSQPAARSAMATSLLASTIAVAVATVFGVPAGYWLARRPAPVAALGLAAFSLPLVLPPVASGIMLLSLFRATALPDSLLGVACAEFFASGSFVALASAAAFSSLDTRYEEAARTLGASETRIFASVALPAVAPAVFTGIAFTWLRALGEYGATSIVAYHPTSLPVALDVALSAAGIDAALALSYGFILLGVVVVALTWILRRRV